MTDRLPPSDQTAEQAVLGCILLAPEDCMAECVARIGQDRAVFYDLRHQEIFGAMTGMYDDGTGIGVITIQSRLKDAGKLEQVGGIAYLSALPDTAVSPAMLGDYLTAIEDKYLLRKMLAVLTKAVGDIYDWRDTPQSLIDNIEREVMRVRKDRATDTKTVKELVCEAIDLIETLHQRQGLMDGLATGFTDLDRSTSGMHAGELIIVGAFSGVGKTSLAMNIAENAVLKQGSSVGVFSLEMTALQLVMRFICSHARVNLRNVRDGFLAERDFPKLTTAAGQLSRAALYFDDRSDLSVFQVRAKARRMAQQHAIKLLVVDYLQLLNAAGGPRRIEGREQEVADISSGLKSLAKELNIPVLALSQLNEDGKVRESRRIVHDADQIWMLEREEKGQSPEAEKVNLWVRKNRNGPRDICVPLTFLKGITRFENAAKIDNSDSPNKPYVY